MKEVKVYGSLLCLLLVGSYLSYSKQEPDSAGAERPTLLDAKKSDIRGLTFYAKTTTVSVTFKKDEQGKDYAWFEVEQNQKKRAFTGSEAFQKALEAYAPFKGVRTLGRLTPDELRATGLEKPERRFVLEVGDKKTVFEVGGRTSGARDHYVRVQGGNEVHLVGSSVLGDLEYPEGRFMQRRLREEALTSVSKVSLAANGKTKVVLHKNRLSPNDSFWAAEAAPEERNETLENYVDKLDKLSAVEYSATPDGFPRSGTPLLVVTWFGEDESKVLNSTEIWKAEAGGATEFYAISPATRVVVRLPKSSGEQIERDLASVL